MYDYNPTPTTGLLLDKNRAMIAGVCAGIARWLGWDPTLFRILFVIVSCLSAAFPGILVYLALWIIMPSDRR